MKNTDEETKDKFGVQEEGDNKPSDTSSDQQLVESVNDEAFVSIFKMHQRKYFQEHVS